MAGAGSGGRCGRHVAWYVAVQDTITHQGCVRGGGLFAHPFTCMRTRTLTYNTRCIAYTVFVRCFPCALLTLDTWTRARLSFRFGTFTHGTGRNTPTQGMLAEERAAQRAAVERCVAACAPQAAASPCQPAHTCACRHARTQLLIPSALCLVLSHTYARACRFP